MDFQTTNSQTTGGTGQDSPTVNAGGNVTVQNAGGQVSLAALEGMKEVIDSAIQQSQGIASSSLDLLSRFNQNQADAYVQQGQQDTSLLQSILESNASLAQHTSTGGADMAVTQSNYLIWGMLGLAALALGLIFWKR